MELSEYDLDEESNEPFPKVICNKFINNGNNIQKFVSSTNNGDLLLHDIESGYTDIM